LKNMTLIAPSRWMSNQARHSALFKNVSIQNIPNGIDTGMFRPIDRHTARELLHLPRNKKLILAGSLGGTADPRKGFQYLGRALRHFSATDIGEDAELVVIGASEPADSTGFNIKTTRLGTMKDDISLALAYSAADLFVAPSTQDNLPNMVMEALSCGTPCLAFDIGGMPDMVRHKKNGYLAEPLDAPGLADGMAYLLESGERLKEMGRRARLKVEREFDSMEIAKRHIGLYENIIKKRA